MSKKHLQYIGKGRIASYRIAPRKPNEDDKPEKIKDQKDFSHQKSIYIENLSKLSSDLQFNVKTKEQLVKKELLDEEFINEFQEHYLIINTYGRIPIDFLQTLKKLYKSVEFKYYSNFNRQLTLTINSGDLSLFMKNMKEISSFDANGPKFISDNKFRTFKLIKNFSYYTASDRFQLDSYNENSFLLQFFHISAGKKEEILKFLRKETDLVEVVPSIYKFSINSEVSAGKHRELINKYVSIFDDIKAIQPGFVDVFVDPNSGIKEKSSFTLGTYAEEKLPMVGIIDSGISENRTIIENLIIKNHSASYIDTTPLVDSSNHGTGVASLIMFGEQIDKGDAILNPTAKVISLKIISASGGTMSGDLLKSIIEEYYLKGVRIFNMSVNLVAFKSDNQSRDLISYILDYTLADPKYRNVLFFISAGNVQSPQMTDLKRKYGGSVNFKFDEGTNICTPADSSNSISVGSINRENHISEFSRKNCLDYGTHLTTKKTDESKTEITRDIAFLSPYGYKPDFVFLGENIKLLSSDFSEEITMNSGTSFSSPLICNMACKILSVYPNLSANSVKALLLNYGKTKSISLGIDGTDGINIPDNIKKRNKYLRGKQEGSDTKIQSRELELLKQRYMGFGKVASDKLVYSDNSKVSVIVEDTIKLNHENIYEINFPEEILSGEGFIKIIGSLSYNHIPILSDHLNYNPIHIAYRLLACSEAELKDVTDKIKDSEKKLLDLTEGTPEYQKEFDIKSTYEKQKNQYVIKIENKGWSHDNYYRTQYSNNQSLGNDNKIRKTTLTGKMNQKLFLEIRCNIKTVDTNTNIFYELKEFLRHNQGKMVDSIDDINRYFDQYFSFCLTIEDESSTGIDIHQSLLDANVGVLLTIEAETSVQAELEQEAEELTV